MKTMNYTDARANFAAILDAVTDDREEVIIHRQGHEPVVIISLEDYESLMETVYLLRVPANAIQLLESMERLRRGEGVARELIDPDAVAEVAA